MTIIAGWRPEGATYDEFASGPKTGRFRNCKICGGMHSTAKWPDNCKAETPWLRSDLASPMIISDKLDLDGVNGMVSMHDGRRYDSKRAYYKSLRQGGCEIDDRKEPTLTHTNEQPDAAHLREVEETVNEAYEQLHSDSFSNDQMANMLRDKQESVGGFHVE